MEHQSDAVRRRAYELWEDAGRPEGGAEDYWYQAEREVGVAGIGEEASAGGFAHDLDTPTAEKADTGTTSRGRKKPAKRG